MIRGERVRLDVHNILYSIYKFNKSLNNKDIQNIIKKHKKEDISFLNNVILNSMRLHLHSLRIIEKYTKKKIKDNEKILLISSVTQIVFLNFKEYAVINCSVEIAKKLKIFHGFINATLKNISRDKEILKNISTKFEDLPKWFKNNCKDLTKHEKQNFLKNFCNKPSLHIVFKDKDKLNNFEENLIRSTEISGFLTNKKDITVLKSFIKGDWWVQDFASFFPLQNLEIKDKNKKFLDACAAPGGKSFQLLSKNTKLVLNDKSKTRIKILKSNLKRLRFNTKIINKNFINFDEKEKFDFIVIDAPCSAVGTIRKNPEIFFRKDSPNIIELNVLQKNLLDKASSLLNVNGLILYMVCSFLKSETEDQIMNFLNLHKDFKLYKFKLLDKNKKYLKLRHNNFIRTLPDTILKYNVDGYFAAYLKKIK